MRFQHSKHWKNKQLYRKDITEDIIEYAIQHSNEFKDKYWDDASNAIGKIPPMGRTLKVIYRKIDKDYIRIITAYWID